MELSTDAIIEALHVVKIKKSEKNRQNKNKPRPRGIVIQAADDLPQTCEKHLTYLDQAAICLYF